MSFNFANQNFDKCAIQGSCVQEPYVNAINEFVVNLIVHFAYYIEKLDELNYECESYKHNIISFFAQINLNFDFHQKDLLDAIKYILSEIEDIEKIYINLCKKNGKYIKILKNEKCLQICDVSQIAKMGEQLYLQRQKLLTTKENTLYTIYIIFLKNMAQNLCEIFMYNEKLPQEEMALIKAFSKLSLRKGCVKQYIKTIKALYETNFLIIEKKYKNYKQYHGDIIQKELNFSTRQNKSILISGRIFKDLENLIVNLKDEPIDIYTHDRMIFAHQYKNFSQIPQLIGQFQKDANSLKHDFSSFPGPIIIGKFKQNKFDGIYRGNFFTTDNFAPYGVSIIKNNDYSQVFRAANWAKGFKKPHIKNTIQIGYDEKKLQIFIDKLRQNILSDKYNSILFIGMMHNKIDNADFYKKLVRKLDNKTFVISLACDVAIRNSIHFNSFYDYTLALTILKELKKLKSQKDFNINMYITECSSFITPNIMLLNYFELSNIFIQQCTKLPNTNNLENILSRYFNTYITQFNINEDIKILKKSSVV